MDKRQIYLTSSAFTHCCCEIFFSDDDDFIWLWWGVIILLVIVLLILFSFICPSRGRLVLSVGGVESLCINEHMYVYHKECFKKGFKDKELVRMLWGIMRCVMRKLAKCLTAPPTSSSPPEEESHANVSLVYVSTHTLISVY